MVSSGAYEKMSAENAAQGAAHIAGAVRRPDGAIFNEPFEAILTPASGGDPTRVYYGGEQGQFLLRPWPGTYTLQAHAQGNRFSAALTLTLVPGTNIDNVDLTIP